MVYHLICSIANILFSCHPQFSRSPLTGYFNAPSLSVCMFAYLFIVSSQFFLTLHLCHGSLWKEYFFSLPINVENEMAMWLVLDSGLWAEVTMYLLWARALNHLECFWYPLFSLCQQQKNNTLCLAHLSKEDGRCREQTQICSPPTWCRANLQTWMNQINVYSYCKPLKLGVVSYAAFLQPYLTNAVS